MDKAAKIIDKAFATRSAGAMAKLVRFFGARSASPSDIARLADELAKSGETIHLGARRTADIASTGGPTSLTTLIVPLILREWGYWIPKLTVSGRPAGGIDVLAQIPGYRWLLSRQEASKALLRCGYAHFLAGGEFAPHDATLFEFRKRSGTLANHKLATASILAKKLAVGVQTAGLEIRVGPHGNFGKDMELAARNARFFCATAKALGIRATCFLADGSRPFQPFLGRGESLLALADVIEGRASGHLQGHLDHCHRMAVRLTGRSKAAHVSPNKLRKRFEDNLTSQGTTLAAFYGRVRWLRGINRFSVTATKTGVLEIDLGDLRGTLVEIQRRHSRAQLSFVDPAGLTFTAMPGDLVQNGQCVALVRATTSDWSTFRDAFGRAFTVITSSRSPRPLEISNA